MDKLDSRGSDTSSLGPGLLPLRDTGILLYMRTSSDPGNLASKVISPETKIMGVTQGNYKNADRTLGPGIGGSRTLAFLVSKEIY